MEYSLNSVWLGRWSSNGDQETWHREMGAWEWLLVFAYLNVLDYSTTENDDVGGTSKWTATEL